MQFFDNLDRIAGQSSFTMISHSFQTGIFPVDFDFDNNRNQYRWIELWLSIGCIEPASLKWKHASDHIDMLAIEELGSIPNGALISYLQLYAF